MVHRARAKTLATPVAIAMALAGLAGGAKAESCRRHARFSSCRIRTNVCASQSQTYRERTHKGIHVLSAARQMGLKQQAWQVAVPDEIGKVCFGAVVPLPRTVDAPSPSFVRVTLCNCYAPHRVAAWHLPTPDGTRSMPCKESGATTTRLVDDASIIMHCIGLLLSDEAGLNRLTALLG
eukprot:364741-Chlamydomonas_euryale.AAC.8